MSFSEIGPALKQQREERGWSKAEAARKTGYHVSSITNMENNSMHVLWSRYTVYMQHLGITWSLVPIDKPK